MGMYLNSIASYAKYKAMVFSPYFVDKTAEKFVWDILLTIFEKKAVRNLYLCWMNGMPCFICRL